MTLLPYHQIKSKAHRTVNALLIMILLMIILYLCATWNYDFFLNLIFYDFSEFSLSPRTISFAWLVLCVLCC